MHVGIIGGGIAGLTAALCLAKHGIEVTLHEQADELREFGAGIQLSPNALRHLFDLGLSSQLNAVASAPRAIDIRDGHSGSLIAAIPLAPDFEKRYGAPYYVLHRADLQSILADACRHTPNINLVLSSKVGSVRQENGGAILAGDKFDIVIAADGVYSATRRRLWGVQHQASGLTAWRSIMPMSDAPRIFSNARTNLCMASKAHFVSYPIASGTELNLVLILPENIAPRPAMNASMPEMAHSLGDILWTPWDLNVVPKLHSWVKGRIVLIGDSAHGMLPFAAQGAAMAIEDAAKLATSLAASSNVADALSDWERAQKPRAERVAETARKNGRIYHLSQPMALARNIGMRVLGGERLVRRQDWIYQDGNDALN